MVCYQRKYEKQKVWNAGDSECYETKFRIGCLGTYEWVPLCKEIGRESSESQN